MYTNNYHQEAAPSTESNAARSPSRAGQHPNTVRDDRNHNPQQMYERQNAGNTRVNGAPPPKKEEGGFWAGAMLMLGAVGLGYMLLKGDDEEDRLPLRQNPGYEPPPPAPTVVVIPPSGVNVTAQMPQIPQQVAQQPQQLQLPANFTIPQPQIVQKTIDPAPFVIPQPVVQTQAANVSGVVVEDTTPKKPRSRLTTQARDEDGHYMPAGTRTRAVTEGKG